MNYKHMSIIYLLKICQSKILIMTQSYISYYINTVFHCTSCHKVIIYTARHKENMLNYFIDFISIADRSLVLKKSKKNKQIIASQSDTLFAYLTESIFYMKQKHNFHCFDKQCIVHQLVVTKFYQKLFSCLWILIEKSKLI